MRRGAKARRTTYQPIDRMASPENQQKHRHKTTQDHGSPKKGGHPHTSLARQDCTWAEAARASLGASNTLARLLPKSHGREGPGISIPLRRELTSANHMQILHRHRQFERISFQTLLPSREMLQRYRTEAHAAIRKRLGVNLSHTNTMGDAVTVVTKKADRYQDEWILITGDIRDRFPNARAAVTTYEQQRKQ